MVKSKYEETEIGVLPEDWEVIDFEDCLEFLPNNTLSRSELNYDFGEVRNIHYGDILIDIPSILDCSKYELPFINTDNSIKNPRSFLRDGDLIVADTAEDETVGKATEIYNIETRKVVSGLHTIACRPKTKFEPKWLGYFINHRIYHDQLIPLITGTKVSAISKSSIKRTKIVKPLPEEQVAIVETIDDMNLLISNLEKLIRKKKAIKEGVMQELMTGKKRLPGFKGEWKSIELSKVLKLQAGYSFKSEEFTRFGIPIIRISNLVNGKICLDNVVYYEEFDIPNQFLIQKDDILIAMSGATTGKISIYDLGGYSYLNQRVGKFIVFNEKELCSEYLGYILGSKQFITQLEDVLTAGAQPNISSKDIEKMVFDIPIDITEQQEIVNTLSSIDSEIESLQQKLNKYQKIKHGMLDELLTGKIRLI